MKPQNVILTCTTISASFLPARFFVGFNGRLAGAGEKALGVTEADTNADSPAPINVLGVMLVESGGPIARGEEVEADANARAVTRESGAMNGTAFDAAVSDGELIRIVRGI